MHLTTADGTVWRVLEASTIGPPTITGDKYNLNATLERDGEHWPGIFSVPGCVLEVDDFRQTDVLMHIRGFRLLAKDDPKVIYYVLLQWRITPTPDDLTAPAAVRKPSV